MYFDKVKANHFRYIQAQADIVVEEIIRGLWGSTALESISLGKPVITFVRKEWEDFYYKCFPETRPIPFIIANKNDIYETLKKVVIDKNYSASKAAYGRKWAKKHLNPSINAASFSKLLECY